MIQSILLKVTLFDERVLNLLTPLYRFVSLKTFWKLVSRTGDGWFYPLAPLAVWAIESSEAWSFFSVLLVAYALDVPAYVFLKKIFKRQRPYQRMPSVENLAQPIDTFSFPSGHTAAASVFTVVLVAFFPSLLWLAVFWCACVGFSRVFLGAHYLTDVLAGAFLGGALGQLSLFLI